MVVGRPLLEVNLVDEDVGLEKFGDMDAHLHDLAEVVLEQIAVNIRVLVQHHMVYHQPCGLNLVVIQCVVDSAVLESRLTFSHASVKHLLI